MRSAQNISRKTSRGDLSADPEGIPVPFSQELSAWLAAPGTKTLAHLEEVFGPRSFAVAVLVLMFLPALPLPTGGISHLFEFIAVILGVEMLLGRQTMWLPARWRTRPLGDRMLTSALPFMVRRIQWFERISTPRLASLITQRSTARLYGLGFVLLAAFAAAAPPFSGLDTLPAMGAVVLALSLLLADALLALIGIIIGTVGVVVIFTVGVAAYEIVTRFFS